MPNTLDRFKRWCHDWWVRNICAECPRELDLADWWSREYCESHYRENAKEGGAVAPICGDSRQFPEREEHEIG